MNIINSVSIHKVCSVRLLIYAGVTEVAYIESGNTVRNVGSFIMK
jgi:hypothetical protein